MKANPSKFKQYHCGIVIIISEKENSIEKDVAQGFSYVKVCLASCRPFCVQIGKNRQKTGEMQVEPT